MVLIRWSLMYMEVWHFYGFSLARLPLGFTFPAYFVVFVSGPLSLVERRHILYFGCKVLKSQIFGRTLYSFDSKQVDIHPYYYFLYFIHFCVKMWMREGWRIVSLCSDVKLLFSIFLSNIIQYLWFPASIVSYFYLRITLFCILTYFHIFHISYNRVFYQMTVWWNMIILYFSVMS